MTMTVIHFLRGEYIDRPPAESEEVGGGKCIDDQDAGSQKEWDVMDKELKEGLEGEVAHQDDIHAGNINSKDSLHPFLQREDGGDRFDTHVHMCAFCGKRVLAMCYGIHKHKMHSDAIVEEADGAHNEAKMRKAFGLC